MKNKIFTLISLAVVFSSQAMAEQYFYDDNGKLIKKQTSPDYWESYENGKLIEKAEGSKKTTYAYDENGNITQTNEYNRGYMNGEFGYHFKTQNDYEYDNQGKVAHIYSYSPVTRCDYDANGKPSNCRTNNRLSGQTDYVYDESGRQISELKMQIDNTYDTPTFKVEFMSKTEYDENGSMTTDYAYGYNKWSSTAEGAIENFSLNWRDIKEYNDAGKIVLEASACNTAGTGCTYKTTYEYDANGNITLKEEYEHSFKTSYEYDTNGNIVKKNIFPEGDVIEQWMDYEYDANGVLLSTVLHDIYGGLETTEYDSHGNVISIVGRTYDPDKDRWYETDARYEYEYDKYGNLIEVSVDYGYGKNITETHTYSEGYYHNKWLENRKLIYTVEEAERVSKPTGNTFRLRYK